MNGRGIDERDADDIGSDTDFRLAQRILASLQHPDCPVHMFDFDASKLARHVAIRLNRNKGLNFRPTQGEHKIVEG